MDPIETDVIPALVPIEHDLFTAARREQEGSVFTYYDAVLKVPIGPIRAGVCAERIVVRMDLGTIAVDTPSISFFGYVRLAVV